MRCLFNTGDWYKGKDIITFTNEDFTWLKDMSSQYLSEVILLEDHEIIAFTMMYLKPLKQRIDEMSAKYVMQEGEWHVRGKHVSLKTGIYGTGPYTSLSQIIKSIITTQPGHQCIMADDTELTIYLFPWKEIQKEFRVVVMDGVVQGTHDEAVAKCALEFTPLYQTYAADVALLDDGTYYAIEPNSIDENTRLV